LAGGPSSWIWVVLSLLTFGLIIWFVKYRVPVNVQGTVDRLIDQKIQGPALTNYSGFLSARFVDRDGHPISEIDPEMECTMVVQFAQQQPAEPWAEPIDLRGGEDAPQVFFRIAIDSTGFRVTLDRKTVSVAANGVLDVPFEVAAPNTRDRFSIFIQVFQKTRLVQVVAPKLSLRNS